MSEASSDDDDSVETVLPVLANVSWFRQYTCVTIKNWKLLTRRPITLCMMLLSSVLSVAFAWVAGRDDEDAIYPALIFLMAGVGLYVGFTQARKFEDS